MPPFRSGSERGYRLRLAAAIAKVIFDDIEDLPDKFWREKKYSKDQGGIKSMFFIPLRVGAEMHGLISVVSNRRKRKYIEVFVQRLRLLGEIFANALERMRIDQKM